MQITAKFPGTCASCRCQIRVGEKIEWQKGAASRHVVCPAGGLPVSVSPRVSTHTRRGRTWHPCGYPGCNPSYCDECDGEGG